MRNHGLFSTLFIDKIRSEAKLDDAGQGRMATLGHTWKNCDRTDLKSLWNTYIKQALSYLSFVPPVSTDTPGVYSLYEDYNYSNYVAVLYLIEPGADMEDTSVGRFWPARLITQLRNRKLTWGILTDGERWRLYTNRTGKPFEEYVELNLAEALAQNDEGEYSLFETFFHMDSFAPEAGDKEERKEDARKLGVYTCRLDQDMAASEKLLEDKVKSPLLQQIDEVLQYICNGFIADTPRKGEEYTEEERREIFESAVKLLYRCLFLFYAESRSLLPSQVEKQEIYAKHSIQALCREAHRFRWGNRTDNERYDLWKHLKGLIHAVNDGDPEYGIMGYNGGLFDDEQEKFLGKQQLRNDFLARALYLMAYVEPYDSDPDKEYPIPYRNLEVRHLGEMYENILEFNVTLADADRIRRRTKKGIESLLASETTRQKSDSLIKKGDVYFGESALERKQTGSYYTPESLVRFLNGKTVIQPLKDRFAQDYRERFDLFIREAHEGHDVAVRRGAAQSAVALVERYVKEVVLIFKLCDPGMGSGHFLVNAADQITDLIVSLLAEIPDVEGMSSPTTCEPNHWRRLVTRHCLYGVDLNPLAVHLAKLSLWLNCFARDHKLTFLDHHLRCGNSLIGIRHLSQLQRMPERSRDAKKKLQKEKHLLELPFPETLTEAFQKAARDMMSITQIAEDDTDRQKEMHEETRRERINPLMPLADLFTAYLMDSAVKPDEYHDVFLRLAEGEAPASIAEMELDDKVKVLAGRHHFFHWPLEFPEVFNEGNGGFDADVGNPPWDILKPNSQEFFSAYDPAFRSYTKQEANRVSEHLMSDHPLIRRKWELYCEDFEQQSEYVRQPSAYRALGKGDINTYKLFLERFFVLLKMGGHLGIVTPSGLYTDQGCQPFRELFFNESRIICLYGFENRWPTVFTAVDGRFKFILFCTEKDGKTESFRCAFMEHDPERLPIIDTGALKMQLEHIHKFSPDTLSIMEFKSQRDIDIAAKIYGNWPLLGEERPDSWNIELVREFDTSTDSYLFNTKAFGCALYEGKVISAYDHKFTELNYWIDEEIVRKNELNTKWKKLIKSWHKQEIFEYEMYRGAFRRIAASTNERTLLSTIIPQKSTAPDTSIIIGRFAYDAKSKKPVQRIKIEETSCLISILNAFISDFVIRLKITTHLDMHFVYTMPVPRIKESNPLFWPLVARCARLICVDENYAGLWRELFRDIFRRLDFWYPSGTSQIDAYGPMHEQDIRRRLAEEAANLTPEWSPACGVHGRKSDRRDIDDRAQLRAEIDAYVAHLYGLTRDEFAYILDTFPVLKRKEEQAFGEFMSKRKCLEEYDRTAQLL
jgi:hypothetical protein